MNPPIVVNRRLEGERLEAFNQMVMALRTLDRLGESDAATALCEAIEILADSPCLTVGQEEQFAALLDQHDAYFADVAFQRFLSDGGESKIDALP
jgi:hypothetical protein